MCLHSGIARSSQKLANHEERRTGKERGKRLNDLNLDHIILRKFRGSPLIGRKTISDLIIIFFLCLAVLIFARA